MLIVPITNKINWKNPPVITMAIILINTFVFFAFQGNDKQMFMKAEQYYFESGLASIEIPHYLTYHGIGTGQSTDTDRKMSREQLAKYHYRMESDYTFREKLANNQIVRTNDPDFARWKSKRSEYEALKEKNVSYKYGFKPAYITLTTVFTCIFLHGGIGHLFGNMVFLWLVGCIIESGCGRVRYTAAYIFGGICATLFFKLIYYHSTIPLIGASGAIAGLMGMLAILFGKNRVKVFYSLGIYFNYIKIRAFFLFILWLGNELLQLIIGSVSNVAYVAHIGGLLAGGAAAFVLLKIPNAVDHDIFKEDIRETIGPMIEQALEKAAKLDFDGGIKLFEQALELDPQNILVLTHLFRFSKQCPEKQKFHVIAEKLITALIKKRENYFQAARVFAEYRAAVKTNRLPAKLLIQLCFVWCELDEPDTAGAMVMKLVRNRIETPGIPAALFKIYKAYQKKGKLKNADKCRDFICSKYPHSNEAGLIFDSAKRS